MDFLYPVHNWSSSFLTDVTQRSSLGVRWFSVADEAFLLARLSGESPAEITLPIICWNATTFFFQAALCHNLPLTSLTSSNASGVSRPV